VKIFTQCSSSAAGADGNGSWFKTQGDDDNDDDDERGLGLPILCFKTYKGMGQGRENEQDRPWMIRTRLNCHLMSIQWQLF